MRAGVMGYNRLFVAQVEISALAHAGMIRVQVKRGFIVQPFQHQLTVGQQDMGRGIRNLRVARLGGFGVGILGGFRLGRVLGRGLGNRHSGIGFAGLSSVLDGVFHILSSTLNGGFGVLGNILNSGFGVLSNILNNPLTCGGWSLERHRL